MKIIIAPDSFKGSLSAVEVASTILSATRKIFPGASIECLPLSDGGEGLVESLVEATGGTKYYLEVTGPLVSKVKAFWGILGDGKTAVIEMAAASGLMLIDESQRNPLLTTSYGTGELIKAALDKGCSRIIIGIGGSATNDGGAGMAQALGAELNDEQGEPISPGGGELKRLAKIDIEGLDPRLKQVEIIAACDVSNSLIGPQGASYIYGPQKGATSSMIKQLDEALKHYSNVIERDLGIKVENIKGSGAAGGLGAGIMAFLNGSLIPGIDLVLDVIGIEEELSDCDLLITGEGRLDMQSTFGKVPIGVALRASKFGVPVVVLAGSVEKNIDQFHEQGVIACFPIVNEPMSLQEAMDNAPSLLEYTASQVLRLYKRASNN